MLVENRVSGGKLLEGTAENSPIALVGQRTPMVEVDWLVIHLFSSQSTCFRYPGRGGLCDGV